MKDELDPWALGATFGIVLALFAVFIGVSARFGYGVEWVELLSSVYLGFSKDAVGILVGCLWAFVDGVIVGALVAFLYNFFSGKMQK